MTDTTQQATRDLADASRYIRTYAKDMAAAGGDVSAEEAKPTPAPQPIITPKPEPAPVESVKEVAPIEKPQQAQPEPGTPEREAILARLRARTAAPQPLPVMQPITPTAPVAQPVPVPAPQRSVAPPPPEKQKVVESPAPLHTYKTDFADEIDTKKASRFSVLAADANAERNPIPEPKKENRTLPTVFAALLLITLGAGGVYGAYLFVTQTPSIPLQPLAPSLVFVDERVELTGPDFFSQLVQLSDEPLIEGNAILVYTTNATTTEQGLVRTPQPGRNLIYALNLGAPDILLRNIDQRSTVGVLNAAGETRAFFVMRVDSYERTYAGMLSWEATILRNLSDLYPEYPDDEPSDFSFDTATSTASSSAAILPETPFTGTFRDEVLQNHDVRVVRDAEGRSILLYGYRDKNTLIITRNEAAYLELVRRLNAQGN